MEVSKMIDVSVATGIDLIELLWIPRDNNSRATSPEIQGYEFPITTGNEDFFSEVVKVDWVEKTLKFYPDSSGKCWGYVFDTEYNRKKLRNSFSNNWYRIVDKKIKDDIMKEAEEAGISTKPAEKVQFIIKKSKREKEAEDKVKATERKLEDLEKRKKELEEALAEATGKKLEYVGKRVKGKMPKDKKEQILNGDNEDNADTIAD